MPNIWKRSTLPPELVEGAALDQEIATTHAQSPVSRLLASIPGDCRQVRYTGLAKIGKIAASAIAASVPDPKVFKSGRDFSAWLGLTPRQNSSSGKEKLGSITKQGNRTIRRLLVLGGAIATSDCGGATSLLRLAGKRKGSPHEIGWSLFSRASPRD